MAGKLILVGTPIGNLGDISTRASQALAEADFIAAEDTRVTLKLLNHLGIKKPLVSYYEHNKQFSSQRIIPRIIAGETCALVTDAGMPAISDPGEDLVRECAESGIEVLAVPGPTAVTSALALSGLPTGRFTFEGFLSAVKKERIARLEELRDEKRTMVFYEAPHKLRRTLEDMLSVLGDRPVALCRELTKLHEQTIRTTLSGAVKTYETNEPRGEYALVVGGAPETPPQTGDMGQAVDRAARYRDDGLSLKDAVRRAAEETGVPKNALYNEVINKKER